MPASHRISYWQADARFKHPLLIAKERELEELRAALLMQRAAFGWLVRLRVKQTKVAQGASQGRKLSITSENWQTEKSLKKKKQTGVRMAVDDAVVVDAGSAAVTLAIKRQAIQTARRNFEQQVATTTVVCEPMDCVLASILRKMRPNKEAQNDRLVARSLRAVHHPLMWPACVIGMGMYWLENANHTFQWFAVPNPDFNTTAFNSTESMYGSTYEWSLNGCTPASDAWLFVAALICCVPLVLWTLTANVPLIKATGLRPETVFVIANVLRWAVCVNFTLDPSCRFFTVLAPFPTVWVLFLWNSIDAVQISQGLRLFSCFFLWVKYLLFIYGMVTMSGHKKVVFTAVVGDWWQMETDLLAHELSAMVTLNLFVTRDLINCIWKPDICKGLQRRVKRDWADRDYKKRGVVKIASARFGLTAAAAGAAAAAVANHV